ncbi:MAG: DUF3309 domain-containing protein [Candidatus Omnitrophica bacterium]|nr:DUF3309 domain-containing protein [Candidatus Omnitrophota bacterium]
MSIETIILLVVLVMVMGACPAWPHSRSWGYGPTGFLSLLLVIFLVWAIAGGRPLFRSSVGSDIRAAGHDVGDAVKRAVQ